MEQHKNNLIIDKNIPTIDLDYIEYFKRAYKFANDNYKEIIDNIQNTKFEELTLEKFWQEYVWCVYTSGFNAKIVSKFYNQLIKIYKPLFDFNSKDYITQIYSKNIREDALKYCNNKRKVDAIFKMSNILYNVSQDNEWNIYKNKNLNAPEKLKTLPFIGPI